MDRLAALIPMIILGFLIVKYYIGVLFTSDQKAKWSPVSFFSMYLVYYIVLPFFKDSTPFFGISLEKAEVYLAWGALISYISFRFAFTRFSSARNYFYTNNTVFDGHEDRFLKIGIILFCIGFVCNAVFNGFSLSIVNTVGDTVFSESDSYNHPTMYLTYLVSLFVLSSFFIHASSSYKRNIVLPLILILSSISYILEGFRFRLLILFFSFICFYYLYPKVKKVKWHIIVPLFLCFYISMTVIEMTRSYGRGLNIEKIENLDSESLKEDASESRMVYEFSGLVMQKYDESSSWKYFEPLLTAVCMPIPRAVFPWKPDGYYLREANIKVLGTIQYGSAFLYLVEAFISFGWLGVILSGLFLGVLSKLFWLNYLKHQYSFGAIALLACYNGVLYVLVSRGYMAQQLTQFFYYVLIPFWVSRYLINRKY